jgi:hypothetical protein
MILLLLATLQATAAPDAGLKRLAEPARHLDAGMKAFLGGKDAVESFKPWDYFLPLAENQVAVREALKKNEAATASCFAVELRVHLLKKGQALGSVGCVVRVGTPEPDFLSIRYRKAPGDGTPLEKCTGPSAPFAAAAKAVFELLKGGKADAVRLTPNEAIEKALPPALSKSWIKGMERNREEIAEALAQVAALQPDEIRVTLDEQWFRVLKADGTPTAGWVRGNLKLDDAGKLVYYLSRFETK